MRLAAALAPTVAALALAACGVSDESGATGFVPAAGANTPSAATLGVPPDASYNVTGSEWLKLPAAKRLRAATDYVADHPGICRNGDRRDAAAATVRDWADVSLGTDFPLNVPVAELLAEGCAAALQSGGRDLAPR